ncbi:HAD family phosphatase [Polaromonas sp. CG_9.11]|uniref:HAD family hydrolase n=1 Tax=Polaromonas sp. CG_9.11 TaxID=2787730 RepID=UPI001A1971AD|nr:HAD family hydrolase [Polaromonas sp. CG_9.11]MBG6075457.1 HAD superfamily hydrolase (TIGR01490 family) [Polaromonas sp. CG_9.11]
MTVEVNVDIAGDGRDVRRAGPPQASTVPPGGSALHEVKSVGARVKLALFDLDHTLIPIDSDYEWGEFTIALGWCDATEFKRRNAEFFEEYRAGTLDIHDYVRFATQAIREQGAINSIAAHARFMSEIVHKAIKSQALELVGRHRAAGDELVIVTATNEFVTRPIADAFGVSELIAVELERDAQGNLTGEIRGTPSAREGKVARMEQWLAARRLAWGDVHTTFYTDSMNDLALLEKVTEPVATNPDPRLRVLATERGWRILDLF